MEASTLILDAPLMMRRAGGLIVASVWLIVAAGCSSSTTGAGASSSSSSGSGGGNPHYCKKNTKTDSCYCSTGQLGNLGSDYVSVPDCDDIPTGASACARYESGSSGPVSDCEIIVPHCGKVNRNFTSCECGASSDTTNDEVSSCSATTCCAFDDKCACTSITGSSLDATQFDKDCTYFGTGNGHKVSSCSTSDLKGECRSGTTKVSSCKGLSWAAPSGGGSSSGSSSGCDGCHADSDCGHCGRCTLSTCQCSTKAVCN